MRGETARRLVTRLHAVQKFALMSRRTLSRSRILDAFNEFALRVAHFAQAIICRQRRLFTMKHNAEFAPASGFADTECIRALLQECPCHDQIGLLELPNNVHSIGNVGDTRCRVSPARRRNLDGTRQIGRPKGQIHDMRTEFMEPRIDIILEIAVHSVTETGNIERDFRRGTKPTVPIQTRQRLGVGRRR